MDRPKQIYPQTQARRLPSTHPCPHCGQLGHIERNTLPEYNHTPDRDVEVVWYCPAPLCEGHDGFWIESR